VLRNRQNGADYARIGTNVSTRINILQAIRFLPSLLFATLLSTAASATTYELGEGTPLIFGEITHYTTTYEDTFTDIARRYSLGWQ